MNSQSTDFQGTEALLFEWMYTTIYLWIPVEYRIPKVNTNINYGLWVILSASIGPFILTTVHYIMGY